MDWFVKRFVKASLTWLGLGVTLGVAMAVRPEWIIYRPAHVHMNLLGFVAMMIFGVAYHVIPRFAGHPLHNRRLAAVHWWVANLGLAALVVGFIARPAMQRPAALVLAAGGALAASGAYVFIYNLWRTIDGPRERRVAEAPSRLVGAPASGGRQLPLASN